MQKDGCENLIVLPLYPQYAAATTATVCDEVYRTLIKQDGNQVCKLYHITSLNPYILML